MHYFKSIIQFTIIIFTLTRAAAANPRVICDPTIKFYVPDSVRDIKLYISNQANIVSWVSCNGIELCVFPLPRDNCINSPTFIAVGYRSLLFEANIVTHRIYWDFQWQVSNSNGEALKKTKFFEEVLSRTESAGQDLHLEHGETVFKLFCLSEIFNFTQPGIYRVSASTHYLQTVETEAKRAKLFIDSQEVLKFPVFGVDLSAADCATNTIPFHSQLFLSLFPDQSAVQAAAIALENVDAKADSVAVQSLSAPKAIVSSGIDHAAELPALKPPMLSSKSVMLGMAAVLLILILLTIRRHL